MPNRTLSSFERGMSVGGGHDYTYPCGGDYCHTHPLLLWVDIPTHTPSSSGGRGHISPCGGDRYIPFLSWKREGMVVMQIYHFLFSVKGKGWC